MGHEDPDTQIAVVLVLNEIQFRSRKSRTIFMGQVREMKMQVAESDLLRFSFFLDNS
jgi:hypothetical protein